jgi:hypothetical protein
MPLRLQIKQLLLITMNKKIQNFLKINLLLAFLSYSSVTIADVTKTFGNWGINTTENGITAFTTTNKDGYVYTLGIVCAETDSCSFFLLQPIACDHTKIYPAIVSSKAGSSHIEILCHEAGGNFYYKIQSDEFFSKALLSGGILSLAMSFKRDFNVIKFDVDNAAQAIDYLLKTLSTSRKNL